MKKKMNTAEQYTKDIDAMLFNRSNDDLLKDVPYETVVGDLALVGGHRYVLDGERHFAVYTDMAARGMQLTGEEITQAARKNMENTRYNLQTINSAIGIPDQEGPRILVLTNEEKYYGAAEMLNRKAMDDAADRLGAKEMYVIPSSVHETLLISKDDCDRIGATPENLDSLVQEVNAHDVRPEERLSDHVYAYDVSKHRIYDPHDQELTRTPEDTETYTAGRRRT